MIQHFRTSKCTNLSCIHHCCLRVLLAVVIPKAYDMHEFNSVARWSGGVYYDAALTPSVLGRVFIFILLII